MTKVDFYINEKKENNGRFLLACRLAEKIYSLGHRIYIHTDSPEYTQAFDDLLWTFKQNSFIPHASVNADKNDEHPVLIGHNPDNDLEEDVLINLSASVPGFFSRFHRVVEVIDQDEHERVAGRERFKFYRERGYPLESHNISA